MSIEHDTDESALFESVDQLVAWFRGGPYDRGARRQMLASAGFGASA